MEQSILTINGGSSSIKFALYKAASFDPLFSGGLEDIGKENTELKSKKTGQQDCKEKIKAADHDEAVISLIGWLQKQEGFDKVTAIGHRIVHGMQHTQPEVITTGLVTELKTISVYDPEHLPEEIKLIEAFAKHLPHLKQVACYDTAFHTTMPLVAKQLAIPRRFYNQGIQRYGFHGLSYAYLVDQLKKINAAEGKVILAHLGSGASLAAVRNGKSIDTSMGFTPAAGIPMSSRSGDLDPGVAWYLINNEKLTPKQFSRLINHESGLLGISETSADMRELLKVMKSDNRAAEAVNLFCYQAKKYIGAYAAALGGLESLVFAGGIGEQSPEIRAMICAGLEFLGVDLDDKRNHGNEAVISKDNAEVTVRVIKTDEELMIARLVSQVLKIELI